MSWVPLTFIESLNAVPTYKHSGEEVKVDDYFAARLPATVNQQSRNIYGRVHAIDLTAELPLVFEWYDGVNNKRITRFHPDGIVYLTLVKDLDNAKSAAGY